MIWYILFSVLVSLASGLISRNLEEILFFISNLLIKLFPTSQGTNKFFFEKSLQKAMKEIRKEAFVGTYNKVKIEVINGAEPDLDVINDTLILRIPQQNKPSENVKKILKTYCKDLLLGRVQDYLEEVQKDSVIDFSSRELSKTVKIQKVVDDLENEIVRKENKNPTYREYINKYYQIRKSGLFFTIFLPEIRSLGNIITYETVNHVSDEYENLLKFLYEIATKERGEEVRLQFLGKISRVAVILVARETTWEMYGTHAYLKRAKELIEKKGFETIYIIAAGDKVNLASKVTRELKRILPLKSHPKKDIKIGANKLIRIYKLDVDL
ncbi:hypothetical protein [Thermotoga sp. SG1]|uniref:hypothetical protein n=1 Tax=Thermotoga sp. SG1 TaxID=126739 RepID=UPI000C7623AB|nr:hypothetical protein [Thermotoga sp. SG1]PLV55754.1 hypothetical protein AS006_08970 [Thermotoga sp. SG1]